MRGVPLQEGISLTWRDVSNHAENARRLAESESLFRQLLQNSMDVVFLEVGGAIRWISPALKTMLGWATYKWTGQSCQRFCHPDDHERLESLTRQQQLSHDQVLRIRLLDHERVWRWVELHASSYRDEAGLLRGYMASFRVVDKEVAAEQVLRQQAELDGLTDLLNRRSFTAKLTSIGNKQQRRRDRIGLLFCDIDFFKSINDTHGHAAGDLVLQTIAKRMLRNTRDGDLVGRLGGDELAVILLGIHSLDEAMAIATSLHQKVSEPIPLTADTIVPTLSIGVTLAQQEGSDATLLARADAAMYQAKQQGRNMVVSLDSTNAATELEGECEPEAASEAASSDAGAGQVAEGAQLSASVVVAED